MKKETLGVYLASVLPAANKDPEAAMRLIAGQGFNSIQFSHYNANGAWSLKGKTETERLRLLVDIPGELGLRIISLSCANAYEKLDTVRERSADLIEAINWAARCHIPIVIIHGGERITGDEEENQRAWKRLLENLDFGIRYATDMGVSLAMEPGGPLWMVHGWKILVRLRNEIGETFKVNYDPANVIMSAQDPIKGVYQLAETIIHCHIKDAGFVKPKPHIDAYNVAFDDRHGKIQFAPWRDAVASDCDNQKNAYVETVVGQGEVDFNAFIKALREIGFEGDMAIECESSKNRMADIIAARECLLRSGLT